MYCVSTYLSQTEDFASDLALVRGDTWVARLLIGPDQVGRPAAQHAAPE
jgi:hypothetical protein